MDFAKIVYELKSVIRSALIWNAFGFRDWYKVTGMKLLVWSALCGMKWVIWLWYEVPGMRWLWYEVHWYELTFVWGALVWSCFGMKWRMVWSDNRYDVTGMKWPWYEVHWYEVALVWSALVWSDFYMKCRMVCSALVLSAWYEMTIFPFGMKWLKKWSDDWMKWLGTGSTWKLSMKNFAMSHWRPGTYYHHFWILPT